LYHISCIGTFAFTDDNTTTRLANFSALCNNNATSGELGFLLSKSKSNIRTNGTVHITLNSYYLGTCGFLEAEYQKVVFFDLLETAIVTLAALAMSPR